LVSETIYLEDLQSVPSILTKLPDNNKEFKNYVLIACARCATEAERPADYKQGICAYATKLKPGTTVTGKVVKASIEALVRHGCERCGSVPVVPGAKDDTDGNVQINFTRGACETGLCQGKPASDVASEHDSAPSEDEQANPTYVSSEQVPGISLRSDSPDSIASPNNVLLGLNCRGSGMCNDLCFRKSIMELDIIMQNLRKFQSPTRAPISPASLTNYLFRRSGAPQQLQERRTNRL
jgi:hypothetical protein